MYLFLSLLQVHTVFSSGAAAAAVMSSSKVTTVLRPASQLPNAATAQPAVQHIIHQPIQASDSHTMLQIQSSIGPFRGPLL